GDERVGILFAERFEAAFRIRVGEEGGARGGKVAFWGGAVGAGCGCEPGGEGAGGDVRGFAILALAIALYAADLQLVQVDLEYTQANSPTSRKYLPETMGGGVALLDYDNDGRLDIFFV